MVTYGPWVQPDAVDTPLAVHLGTTRWHTDADGSESVTGSVGTVQVHRAIMSGISGTEPNLTDFYLLTSDGPGDGPTQWTTNAVIYDVTARAAAFLPVPPPLPWPTGAIGYELETDAGTAATDNLRVEGRLAVANPGGALGDTTSVTTVGQVRQIPEAQVARGGPGPSPDSDLLVIAGGALHSAGAFGSWPVLASGTRTAPAEDDAGTSFPVDVQVPVPAGEFLALMATTQEALAGATGPTVPLGYQAHFDGRVWDRYSPPRYRFVFADPAPADVPPPRRQRQRDDGLTSSAVRQRSATSRQRSVRQRSYL